jgi:hypothetical protein
MPKRYKSINLNIFTKSVFYLSFIHRSVSLSFPGGLASSSGSRWSSNVLEDCRGAFEWQYEPNVQVKRTRAVQMCSQHGRRREVFRRRWGAARKFAYYLIIKPFKIIFTD